MFDMSEFVFEKNISNLNEARELTAQLWAMPLQRITALEEDGVVGVLACRHKQLLLPAFREGINMRCLQCYNERMRSAQKMVEGADR